MTVLQYNMVASLSTFSMKKILGCGVALILILHVVRLIPVAKGPSFEASLLTDGEKLQAAAEITLSPERTETVFTLLETVLDKDRDFAKGNKILAKTLPRGKNQELLDLYRAKILSRTLAFDKALEILKGIPEEKITLLKAATLIAKNDRVNAESLLREASLHHPDISVRQKAQALLSVYATFDRHRDVDESYLWTLLAQKLGDLGELEISHYLAQKAVKKNPGYRDAWTIKGYDELVMKKPQDAELSLLSAYQLDTSNPNIQYLLGLTYSDLGKPELSTRYLLSAKNSSIPYLPIILEKLGENSEKQKDFAMAAYYYDALLSQTTDKRPILEKLVVLFADSLAQPEKAKPYAEQLVQSFSDEKSKALLNWIHDLTNATK